MADDNFDKYIKDNELLKSTIRDLKEKEKKLLEEILQLKYKLFICEEILYNLDAALSIHDLQNLKHIWTNKNYLKIVGYDEREILDMNIEEEKNLYHPNDIDIIEKRIKYLRSGNNKPFICIYRMKHKSGHWVWLYCTYTVFKRDSMGNPIQILGIVHDFNQNICNVAQFKEYYKEFSLRYNGYKTKILTSREKEVLKLIANGYRCKEIADKLFISHLTVETHKRNIVNKLGVNSNSRLTKYAMENGLY